MKLNQDSHSAACAVSAVQVCKRLSDREFHSADFSVVPLSMIGRMAAERASEQGIMVGIVCSGTIRTQIDGNRYELRRNDLLLLRDDSVIENFKCSKACSGYVFAFSRRFLDGIDVSVRDLISARVKFRTAPCVSASPYDVMRLHNIALALSDAVEGSNYIYDEKILSSLFSAFFYTLASVMSADRSEQGGEQHQSRSEELIRQFMSLLDGACCEQRSVEYYASQMGITPKYLSLICRTQTGQSASKVIDDVVIRKAKELLGQSGISVQEVAERLNFVSQSFFAKYFKLRVGMSPSRYKAQLF